MGDPYAALGQVVTPPAAAQPPAQGADPYAQLGEQQGGPEQPAPDFETFAKQLHALLADQSVPRTRIQEFVAHSAQFRNADINTSLDWRDAHPGEGGKIAVRQSASQAPQNLSDLVRGSHPGEVVTAAPTSATETGIWNFANGALANTGDKISAAVETVLPVDKWFGNGDNLQSIWDGNGYSSAYQHNLGIARAEGQASDAAHPVIAPIANLAGAIASPINKIAAPVQGASIAANAGRVAAAGAVYGGLSGAGQSDADTWGGVAKDSATQAGVQGALGFGLGAAGEKIGNAFARRAANKAATNALVDAPAVANAAAQEGVPISRPFLDPSVRNKLTHLETTKGGAPVVAQGLNDTSSALEGRVNALADQGTALNTDIAGGKIQAAGRDYIDTTRGQKNALYGRAEKLAGDVTVVPQAALSRIDARLTELRQAPTTNKPIIDYLTGLRSDLAKPGGLSLQTIRDIRSGIRGQVDNAKLTQTKAGAYATEALTAASQDINGALGGNAPALAAYKTADKFFAQRQQTITNVVQQFIGRADNPLSAEKAFAKFQAMASPGGDAARLARMRALLPPEDQADLAATFAHSLGRDAAGSFSPALFVSQAAKLSEAARTHLFGAEGEASIKRLLTVATQYRDVSRNLNHSRSGVAMNYRAKLPAILGMMSGGASLFEHGMSSAAVTGAGVSIAATAANTVADRLSAKALMNPDVSRWIVSAPATSNKAAIANHIARLAAVIARNPGLATELNALKDRLVRAANDNMPNAAAASDQQQQNKQ